MISPFNDCIHYQEKCPYIEPSLLKSPTVVSMWCLAPICMVLTSRMSLYRASLHLEVTVLSNLQTQCKLALLIHLHWVTWSCVKERLTTFLWALLPVDICHLPSGHAQHVSPHHKCSRNCQDTCACHPNLWLAITYRLSCDARTIVRGSTPRLYDRHKQARSRFSEVHSAAA